MKYILKKNSTGFTLLEGLIATFVYTAVLAAAVGVMARGIHSTTDFQNENIAYLLASEGIESVQAIRGDNYVEHARSHLDDPLDINGNPVYVPVPNATYLQPVVGGPVNGKIDECVADNSSIGCIVDPTPTVYDSSVRPHFRIGHTGNWDGGQLYLYPLTSGVPDESSNYTHASVNSAITPFQRIITAESRGDLDGGALVTSTVRWQSGSIYKTAKTQKYFKNWY